MIACSTVKAHANYVREKCRTILKAAEQFEVTEGGLSRETTETMVSECVGMSNLEVSATRLQELAARAAKHFSEPSEQLEHNVGDTVAVARSGIDAIAQGVASQAKKQVWELLVESLQGDWIGKAVAEGVREARKRISKAGSILLSMAAAVGANAMHTGTAQAQAPPAEAPPRDPQTPEGVKGTEAIQFGPLFRFLDLILTMASHSLFATAFKAVRQSTWKVVHRSLCLVALGAEGKGLSEEHHHHVLDLIGRLTEFFNLGDETTRKDVLHLQALIVVSPMTSEDLEKTVKEKPGTAWSEAASAVLRARAQHDGGV